MEKLFQELNEKQKEAVMSIEGPVLILAGPGSGKTKILTFRIAYLIQKGIAPQNILAVTFTNKAAGEMKQRIKALLTRQTADRKPQSATESQQPVIGTFHSVSAQILRKEIACLNYKNNFLIYDEKDQLNLIKQIIKELNLRDDQFKPATASRLISQAKNELTSSDDFAMRADNFYLQTIAKIYSRYQEQLKKFNALDFDDLIMLVIKIFQNFPEVLEKYQEKLRHILVDEYQDTNHSQYVFVKMLAQKYNNICVVGDEGQSIYGFRQADIRNILNFENDWPEAKVILLEQNYRSTQNILSAATSLISRNIQKKDKVLWTENPQGSSLTVFEAEDEIEEKEFLTNEVENLSQSFRLRDLVVLYRTNVQSRILEEGLIERGLPYKIVGNVKFYDRKEIKDLLSWFKLILNPDDLVSKERVLKIPLKNQPSAKGQKSQKIDFILNSLKGKLTNLSLSELLALILEKSGYKDYLRLDKKMGGERLENVAELFSVMKKYDCLPAPENLNKFLEEASLMQNHDEVEQEKEALNLMTLHCAKGLEFDVVFIVGLEEGLLPHQRSLKDRFQLEEERRLCYVGLTRARQEIYLTWAKKRNIFGQTLVNIPSRFLKEIPPYLIKNVGGRDSNIEI